MKVLIYFDKNLLEPIGGPTGYLYNLYNELTKEKIESIEFLNSEQSKLKMQVKRMYKKLPKYIQKKYKNYKKYRNRFKVLEDVLSDEPKTSRYNLNEYDIIHFHCTLDMYKVKDSLENFKGKIIISSHSPKVYYKEIIEDRTNKEDYLKRKEDFDKLEIIDEYAFNRADYIIFPCEQAEEPYYHTWEKYSKIKENNKDKYRYLPTGIIPIKVNESKDEIKKLYNIPSDAFLVTYIGRHNEVKGYDKLKEIGEKILEKYSNVYFLIAGAETPLKGLKHDRWIEIGWTDKPYEIINASDLFILPNKETYFDLILLEVISIGKTVLLTSTGGNKYFNKYDNSGLFYYDYNNNAEAIEQFSKILNKDVKILGNKNKEIFEENFTIERFTKNYIEILNEIYN